MLQILLAALALCAAPANAASAPAAPNRQSDATAEALAQALARWKVEAATSGKDAEVAAAIDELWRDAETAAAARPGDAALAAQLADIGAARTKFRLERGLERQDAEPSGEVEQGSFAEDEIIVRAVNTYLSKGERPPILELGARAIPHLTEVARSMSPASAAGAPAFALETLAQLDAPTALDVCWELAQQESFLVRKAVVDVAAPLYQQDDVWKVTSDGLGEPRKLEWSRLIELVLAEPGIDPVKFSRLFYGCAAHGYAPPHVIDGLMRIDDPMLWPDTYAVAPGARPLLVAGLGHQNEAIRLHCAEHVSLFPDPTPLFALHSDPSVEVRTMVAQSLGERQIPLWPPVGERPRVEPVMSPEWWAALSALLDDEFESVRRGATGHGYRYAFAHPEKFLEVALELDHVGPRADALKFLAQSTSAPAVVSAAFEDTELRADPDMFHSLVSRLASHQYDTDLGRAVASALLDGLESTADRQVWVVAFDPYPRQYQQPRRIHWIEWLSELDRLRTLRGLALRAPDLAWSMAISPMQPRDPGPWRALVLDHSEPAFLRMCAAGWSLGDQPPDPPHLTAITRAIAEGLVVALAPVEGTPSAPLASQVVLAHDAASWASQLDRRLFESGAPAFALPKALLRDPHVPDRALQSLDLDTSHGTRAEGTEIAQAILARFPVDGWPTQRAYNLFHDVLELAPGLPAEQRIAVIGAALHLGRSYQDAAVDAASEARDPQLLDALRQAAFEQRIFPIMAARAASSFLSDEAAKLILDLAAESSRTEERAEILAALDQVMAYQQAKASWEQRNDAEAVRAKALAELVALAEDEALPEEQRAAALRGLGLLGAVEELPRLVRALGSPSEALRQAAQEALERLNVEAPK